jgi:outer membrane immunogenic protein
MKAYWIGGAAALVVAITAGSAAAQDFGDTYDWTGGYIGADLGYALTDSNSSFLSTSPYAAIKPEATPKGFIGGVHAGYNQQAGNLVFGIEGTASIGNITETRADPLIAMGLPAGNTVTSSSDYQGSIRAKAGIAAGNFMPYLTAGIAGAHLKTSATNSVGSPLHDETFGYGWVAGVGVDVAVADNWSVNAEYLHSDLSAPNLYVGENYETKIHPTSNTFQVGLSYHFK